MNVHDGIYEAARRNTDFRRVLATGRHGQLVAMCIPPRAEIGEEIHQETDQMFFVVKGEGQAIVDGRTTPVEKGDIVFVPAGARHNLKNRKDDEDLKLVTVYAPPAHAEGTVHRTRAEAMAEEAQKEPALA